MNRHEQRIIAMKSIYQHLLLDKDIRKCVYECMDGCNEIDGYLYSLTIGTAENKEKYMLDNNGENHLYCSQINSGKGAKSIQRNKVIF